MFADVAPHIFVSQRLLLKCSSNPPPAVPQANGKELGHGAVPNARPEPRV